MDDLKASILIVDDEEPIRSVLSSRLQAESYDCVTAVDGEDALEKASNCDFDVVLLDVKMPGMSGIEVLPQMITELPNACVIMSTAVVDLETAVEALNLGAFDYVTKPFDLDDLAMRVGRAIEMKRLLNERDVD